LLTKDRKNIKNVIGLASKIELSTLVMLPRMKLSIMTQIFSFKAVVMDNEELLTLYYAATLIEIVQ
jgi:hypothetical protein